MTALDHLVVATPDLAATVAEVEQTLGLRTTPGGQHVGLGTRNHLLSFGDGSYLEIVGPDPEQPDPAQPRPFGVDDLDGPRLVTWAVRVDDMDRACAAARAAGYDPGPDRSMRRATPAGEVLAWRLTPAVPGGEGLIPFLIDWGTTRHPSTTATVGITLAEFRAEHRDPAAITRSLRALGAGDLLSVSHGDETALIAVVIGPGGSLVLG